MADKWIYMMGIFNDEVSKVTQSYERWLDFLKTASNNYKYTFLEQILIFNQKPYAIACADIDFWNNKMGRWVNRGATGIALFDYSSDRAKLKYVFDVSDTHSRYNEEVPIWKAEERYYGEIIQTLINKFGECADGNIESVIDDTAKNLVEDNITDYFDMIKNCKFGTAYQNFDDNKISEMIKEALSSSIGFMIMERCGLDGKSFYDKSDFNEISNFNTNPAIISMGTALNDIALMGLREIELTVRTLRKNEKNQNRTFVNENKTDYYIDGDKKILTEGRKDNEQFNLQNGGRFQNTQHYDNGRREEYSFEQVRQNEKEISSGASESTVQYSDFTGKSDEASVRNSERNGSNDKDNYGKDDEGTEHYGKTQGEGTDDLGGNDEQYRELGSSDGNRGNNLQVSGFDFNAGGRGKEYFYQDKEKNKVLREYLEPYRDEIAVYLKGKPFNDNGSFLLKYFNSKPFETVNNEGLTIGFNAYSDVVQFYRGNRDTPEREAWETYRQLERAIRGMILLNQWTDPEPLELLSQAEQISIIESKKHNGLFLPQEAVDYVLTDGSGFHEGKFRIYRYFNETLSKKDKINFLKNEYGTGGHTDAIPGSGYWESHNANGIEIMDYNDGNSKSVSFNWEYVESRISLLISLDRYLNTSEKEKYTQWLAEKENAIVENQIKTESEKNPKFASEEKKYRYNIKSDDKVFIGSDEYTVVFPGTEKVILSDVNYPILTKEMDRAEFDRKISETPGNEQYRIEITAEDVDKFNSDTVDMLFDDERENEITVLERILNKLKIDDIELLYDENDIFNAVCEDYRWNKEDFYNFLYDECFVFEDDGSVLGLDKELEDKFYEYAEKFNIKKKEPEKYINVEGEPVGRIEYYSLDGQIRERAEYTSEKKFVSDIKEQNNYGVPMNIVLYRDKNGLTISQKFIFEMEPPPKGLYFEDRPAEKEKTTDLHSEIKSENLLNFKIENDEIGTGTPLEKYNRNTAAIRLLKKIESENRLADKDEQNILSQYVGWGGLSDCFDEKSSHYNELKSILTPDEYAAARESTLTAFYTPPVVIKSIYKALENMGFSKGNILEPSCGVGNFMGLLPDNMSESTERTE